MRWPLVLLFLCSNLAGAAPFPGTSTSTLAEPHRGRYLSRFGFNTQIDQHWLLDQRNETSQLDHFSIKFTDPTVPGSALSINTDILPNETTLEKYVKRWVRDYSHYGFDVLSAKVIDHRNKKGFLVDVFQKSSGKQSRQIFFLNNRSPIVITCLSGQADFSKILPSCDRTILAVRWTEGQDRVTPLAP